MKSYEETAQSVLSRRDEYNKRKKKRITVLVSALCVCLAAAIAVPAAMKSAGNADESLSETVLTDHENAYDAGGGGNEPVRGGANEIAEKDPAAEIAQKAETEFETNSDEKNEKPDVEIKKEPRDEPRDPVEEGIAPEAGNAAFMPDNADGAQSLEITPMISSFGTGEAGRYSSVQNGEVIFSASLSEAMANYGDAVRYRVAFDLFCDGVMLDPAGDEAVKVLGSLASRGIITAYESGVSENGAFAYLTLHASYENLMSLSLNPAFGYALYLYGEYTGCTEEIVEVSGGFAY